MFFPLYDENPCNEGIPWTTWSLIAVNTLVFFLLQPSGEQDLSAFFREHALVPSLLAESPLSLGNLLDMFRSMFLHGDFLHLAGNMFFLFIFGDNVEDTLGVPRFLALYLAAGFAAELTHVLAYSNSQAPLVGASGAISGVLGAYLVLFPQVSVRCLVGFWRVGYIIKLPIWAYVGFWFLGQVTNAYFYDESSGVAFLAHAGGFLMGFMATFLTARRWGEINHLVIPEELRRVEASEEQAAVRQAGPTAHDSGMQVVGLQPRPRKKT